MVSRKLILWLLVGSHLADLLRERGDQETAQRIAILRAVFAHPHLATEFIAAQHGKITDEKLAQLKGHTGIFSTMRADGYPISLPVWYVTDDGVIYARTPEMASKLKRIRRNPRGSFLVEHGLFWRELQAVMVSVDAQIIDDESRAARVFELMNAKYKGYRTTNLPDASKRHYSKSTAIALTPVGPFVTWDNTRLRLPTSAPE